GDAVDHGDADVGGDVGGEVGHARAAEDHGVGFVVFDCLPTGLGDDLARRGVGVEGEDGQVAGVQAEAEAGHAVALEQVGGAAEGAGEGGDDAEAAAEVARGVEGCFGDADHGGV